MSIFAYADRSATCTGSGERDYVVASINANSNDSDILLYGYGNLYNSSVYVTATIKTPNGKIITRSEWVLIRNGYGYIQPPGFGRDIDYRSYFISVKVSNPKCN